MQEIIDIMNSKLDEIAEEHFAKSIGNYKKALPGLPTDILESNKKAWKAAFKSGWVAALTETR